MGFIHHIIFCKSNLLTSSDSFNMNHVFWFGYDSEFKWKERNFKGRKVTINKWTTTSGLSKLPAYQNKNSGGI